MDHSSTTSPSRTDPPPCRPRRKILKPAWPLVRRVLPGRTQLCRTLHEYGLERAACLTSTFTCHTLASLNSVDTSWGRTQPPTLLPYYPSVRTRGGANTSVGSVGLHPETHIHTSRRSFVYYFPLCHRFCAVLRLSAIHQPAKSPFLAQCKRGVTVSTNRGYGLTA